MPHVRQSSEIAPLQPRSGLECNAEVRDADCCLERYAAHIVAVKSGCSDSQCFERKDGVT